MLGKVCKARREGSELKCQFLMTSAFEALDQSDLEFGGELESLIERSMQRDFGSPLPSGHDKNVMNIYAAAYVKPCNWERLPSNNYSSSNPERPLHFLSQT
ncbi:hypothetical protein PoB_000366900 [Plakobranchus ocellatus]|uniref:Uncharacterized protein n=1 Tax=Plakobranchus ocellatus TaxID=259542 RepID=A0AAV3Y4K2_9GAST|nr:hypothetical protein PoB_000366900 [Plakobranchus ocellatus]